MYILTVAGDQRGYKGKYSSIHGSHCKTQIKISRVAASGYFWPKWKVYLIGNLAMITFNPF